MVTSPAITQEPQLKCKDCDHAFEPKLLKLPFTKDICPECGSENIIRGVRAKIVY